MIRKPYLIFIGDTDDVVAAKTGFGLRDWARDDCLGQWRLPGCGVDLGLPDFEPEAAAAAGAGSLLIGVANFGGGFPESWVPHLLRALEAGLDIVAGMHRRLSADPVIAAVAARLGRTLYDVRFADQPIPLADGHRRSGKRILTVGTDCALGKKYTALALTQELRRRGIPADFRATGQTGIMIAGNGIAIDAVVADFISGAAELISPDAAADHWDVIEGQGSIYHPAYSGVTMGLLHGSQPDAMVLCHEPGRTAINRYEDYAIPPLPDVIALYETLAQITNPTARVIGISLNTSKLDDAEARAALAAVSEETGLPAADPVANGMAAIVDNLPGP